MTPTATHTRHTSASDPFPELGPIEFDADRIRDRVRALAEDISDAYLGSDVVLVGILPGAVMFVADLLRSLSIQAGLDFIAISRFGPSESTQGAVHILKDMETPIGGKDVLLVEDIVDTGLTLHHIMGILIPRQPASIKVCAFLERPARRLVRIPVEFVGFEAPEAFLVGYGLQFEGRYRQLPYVAQLDEGVVAS